MPAGRLVAAVGQLISREASLQKVFVEVARLVTEALGADGCLIYQVEDSGELVLAACSPPPPPGTEPLRLPGGYGVTGRVAADGIPAVMVDDNPRNPLHRVLLGLADGQRVSRLCVPARAPGDTCCAVLALHSRSHREFGAADIETAQQVADLVGLRAQFERASAALTQFHGEWENLLAATVTAQEAERRRIAGDLHDGVTQLIASLTFHLSAADVALAERDVSYASEQVAAARSLADLAFAETRNAISGLHSPVLDDLGLAAGLVSMARAVPNLRIEVDAQDINVPEHVENALFRIAQEAVQNVVKHAGADKAVVSLSARGRTVILRISDDGHGFSAPGPVAAVHGGHGVVSPYAASSYGLTGMYERVQLLGGYLSVGSQPDEGTTVEIVLPDVVDEPPANAD